MGKSSTPAPQTAAPATPQPTQVAVDNVDERARTPSARAAARAASNADARANLLQSAGGDVDPISQQKTLSGGSASMLG